MKTHSFDIRADASVRGGLPSWLKVVAQSDKSKPVELLVVGPIGKTWDDSGVDESAFRQQLAEIPETQDIVVGINSQGGSVQAGLGIYNALRARSGRVTTRNDGYAASIASLILCAGDRVVSPPTAAIMIHDPWTMVAGNSEDMDRAKRMLEANADVMVAAYSKRTGKSAEEIRAAMKAETWFTGESAQAWGLVDEVTKDKEADLDTLAASFDPDRHPKAPEYVRTVWATASGRSPANRNTADTNPMNRTAILALLKKHGINVAADATDATLLAELNKLVEAGKVEAAQRDQLNSNPQTPPQVPAPAQAQAPAPAQGSTPAPAQAAGPTPEVAALQARVISLEAENGRQRHADVSRRVDSAIAEFRIPAAQRDNWIRRGLADASILDDLAAMPQRLPGAEPIADIEVTSASLQDIGSHFHRLCSQASASFLRGNNVSMQVMAQDSSQAAHFFSKNRNRLLQVLNAITIPADLKRNVILQEIMTAFARRVLPLRAFSNVFSNVPLQGTDIVSVPYFALVTDASTDFNPANGYVMGDGTQGAKNVTVNRRKYQPLQFSSVELARQPATNVGAIMMQKADKLGFDVIQDVLSVVTAVNYGAAAFTGLANTFDSADIADLKGVADVANWPALGRALIVKSGYDINLLKDTGIKSSYAFGSAEPIRLGTVPSVYGFDYYMAENIPANGQNLVGMISFPSAILVATAPIAPTSEVRGTLSAYQVVTHPDTGATLEYRRWGNPDMDQSREVVEVNYGFAVGEAAALKRMVSA